MICFILLIVLVFCGEKNIDHTKEKEWKNIGVLLVNHGSHSKKWREVLYEFDENVRNSILKKPKIYDVKTAHMEYTEPSIAAKLKEFDVEGFDEIVVIPIFLTVSSHYSHDIPAICSLSADSKIKAELAEEKIEVYLPKAKVIISSPLD
jgi:sirohydrochlorin ferrochelatase